MPLFDAIEADVTAFLVSQGSVLDTLIKSLLDRVATVEHRVQLLRSDVTSNIQTIRQQLVNINGAGSGRVSGSASAMDVNAVAEAVRLAAAGRQGSDERALEMARQLNAVLELVFCAHPAESAVADIRSKQAGLARIEDVLRENERILSSLGEAPSREVHGREATSDVDSSGDNQEVGDSEASAVVVGRDEEPAQSVVVEVEGEDDTPELTPIREGQEPRGALEAQDDGTSEEAGVSDGLESGSDHGSDTRPTVAAEGDSIDADAGLPGDQNDVDEQSEQRVVTHRRSGRDDRHRSGSGGASRFLVAERGTRKKSVYHAYQDLALAEEARLRELRLRDDELLGRMREMLEQAVLGLGQSCQHQGDLQAQLQGLTDDSERMRGLAEQSERQQQAMEEALSLHTQRLGELYKRLEHHEEQQRRQEDTAERDSSRREQLVEQQLQDATTQLIAMLEAHAQAAAANLEALKARLDRELVARDELDERLAQWQRTATSNCVFGATPSTLEELQRELESLRSAKANPTTDGEADAELLDAALDRLAQTVEEALEVARGFEVDSGASSASQHLPLSTDGLRVMKALRVQLGQVNDLVGQSIGGGQRDPTEEDDSQDVGLLAATLRRMELGTASLLDGCDAQFSRFQDALRAQQGAVGQLQQHLRQQTQSETALRARLALCPSQEDTQRLLQALEDKIAEVASGSASLTAAALADLRAKLTDLPSHKLLRRLALDVHGKADRAEMERLRSLLEAHSSSGLPAALTKSPLRCLSCDQTLFSTPTSAASRPSSPSSPSRPPAQLHDCQNCRHGPSPSFAGLGAQETGYGDAEHLPRVWSSPSFATSTTAPATATATGDSGDISDELFAVAAAARQRRQREQQQLAAPSPATAQARRAATAGARRAFVNLDDGRNRIPLRRPVLADHIVYGPSIAPHSFRKKAEPTIGPNDARMGALQPEIRTPGQVIARTSTATALVRPFAELERGADRQHQPQHQLRSDRGNR